MEAITETQPTWESLKVQYDHLELLASRDRETSSRYWAEIGSGIDRIGYRHLAAMNVVAKKQFNARSEINLREYGKWQHILTTEFACVVPTHDLFIASSGQAIVLVEYIEFVDHTTEYQWAERDPDLYDLYDETKNALARMGLRDLHKGNFYITTDGRIILRDAGA